MGTFALCSQPGTTIIHSALRSFMMVLHLRSNQWKLKSRLLLNDPVVIGLVLSSPGSNTTMFCVDLGIRDIRYGLPMNHEWEYFEPALLYNYWSRLQLDSLRSKLKRDDRYSQELKNLAHIACNIQQGSRAWLNQFELEDETTTTMDIYLTSKVRNLLHAYV